MSVNVSLSDTPGVSAYFDGQPIQDQADEEVRREEERQEKELRDLLASELEDFEDDFLSESNSDEDSMNISHASTNRSRYQKDHSNARSADFKDGNTDAIRNSAASQQLSSTAMGDDWMMRMQGTSGPTPSPHPQAFHPRNYPQAYSNSEGYQADTDCQNSSPHTHNPTRYQTDPDGHFSLPQAAHNPARYHQPDADYPVSSPHSHQSDNGRFSVNSHQERNMMPSHHQMADHFGPNQNIVTSVTTPTLAQDGLANRDAPPPLPLSTPPSLPFKGNNSKPIPQNTAVHDEGYDGYQVRYATKSLKPDQNPESYFYLGDKHADFFIKEGPEDRRTYEQLEILYRARGRELEEIQWKLEKQNDDGAKEIRILKHKFAVASGEAEGAQESLKQCQILLQQSKSDLTDSNGRIRALETQISSLTDVKEELIKKLQIGESTIENLTHQVQELQDTESLSRARNEHDAVVSSLTQRYDREVLSLKEKLDQISTDLSIKTEEICWLKKQLSDSSNQMEQAQISRGETINKLTKSLEDSQKQCQSLLERSSGHELTSLRVQLQQTIASKNISDDMCTSYQSEIKELKEHLNMFESASALGAVTTAGGASTHSGPSLDDSMTDLGIKKTLDFGTPHSTSNVEGTCASDDLISSLRNELERCLRSNKQKRQEVTDRKEELKSLKIELQTARDKLQEMERTCVNQRKRLDEIDSMMSSQDTMGIVEAKFKRDVDNLKRERALLLEDLEDHKKRLEELGASEARVTEINTELSQQIAQMVKDFDSDKCAALERSQRTLEEVHRMTLNNLRSDMESRWESEKAMLMTSHKNETDNLRKQLVSSSEEIDQVKNLYIKTCEERSTGEQELRDRIQIELGLEMTDKERKHQLAFEEHNSERQAWNCKKIEYETEINSLESQVNKLKIACENDKENVQELLSAQMEKAYEEWRLKLDALTETLSEEKNAKEKILKEKQLLQEEIESIKLNEKDVEDKSAMTDEVESMRTILLDCQVQTDPGVPEKLTSSCLDVEKDVNDNNSSEVNMRNEIEKLKFLQAQEVEALRSEHKKEFENAARKREEKFQTELRYFLKDKDEKAREKLELALIEQKQKLDCELEDKLKIIETEHRRTLQQLEVQLKEAQESQNGTKTDRQEDNFLVNSLELKERELERMKEEYKNERLLLNMKIDEMKKANKTEIDSLTKKHEIEIVALKEKHKQDIEKLKLGEESKMGRKELSEDAIKVMEKRVQEERAKWFTEAQAYIQDEIETGVKLRTEELERKVDSHSNLSQRQEEEVEEEIKARVQRLLDEEKEKLRTVKENRELDKERNVEDRVRVKVQAEVENLKTKFLLELNSKVAKEKRRLEEDLKQWKQDTKKRIEDEKEKFSQSVKLNMEKKLNTEKQDILKKKEEEIESLKLRMEEEMHRKLRNEIEKMKEGHGNSIDIDDMKEQLQSEVDARSKACAERDRAVQFLTQREKLFNDEKQRLLIGLKECRDNLNAMKEEQVALEEKCSQMERKYKDDMREAKKKKENALSQLNAKFNDEKEGLVQTFKSHINAMNEEFNRELEKVRHDCEMEKASALLEVRSHAERALTISPLQEPDMEATTLFELRDHYLDTVKKIKADVMNHVQAANTRAASTLRTEMRKQKMKLIKVFKEKCKSSIRAILSRQVPTTCINSIEHSIDVISESLVTTPTTPLPSKSPASTPRSSNGDTLSTPAHVENARSEEEPPHSRWKSRDRSERRQHRIDERRIRDTKAAPAEAPTPDSYHLAQNEEKSAIRQKMSKPVRPPQHGGHYQPFSQLAKVDLSDNDSVNQSPLNSNHSSPAAVRQFTSTKCKSPFTVQESQTFHIPRLDLSAVDETTQDHRVNAKQKESDFSEEDLAWKSCPSQFKSKEADNDTINVNSSPWDNSRKQQHMEKSHQVGSDEEVEASPRERLKMIEARVRLANWASNGEMPWKSLEEEDEKTEKGIQDMGTSSPLYSVSCQFETQKHLSSNTPTRLNRERGERDGVNFIRPGKEAEEFIASVKTFERKKCAQDAITVRPKGGGHYVNLDGYQTDESSNESHHSLITLEPDPSQSEFEDRQPKSFPSRGYRTTSKKVDRVSSKADYDRIKAAVLNKGSSHTASQRPVSTLTGEELRRMGFESDTDTDSSSAHSQNFATLPTSTPSKNFTSLKAGRTTVGASDKNQRFEFERSRRKPDHSPDKYPQSRSDDRKNLMKFADSGLGGSSHRESSSMRKWDVPLSKQTRQESRQRTRSVERPTHSENKGRKTPDMAFPMDRSSITWSSEDHYGGGGMWRYKSLEDILASLNSGDAGKEDSASVGSSHNFPANASDDVRDGSFAGYYQGDEVGDAIVSRRHQKSDPVQAMNSEFWAQHSIEDREDGEEKDYLKLNMRAIRSNPASHHSRHESERRKFSADEVRRQDKQPFLTPNKRRDPPKQPTFSSEPRQASSSSRHKQSTNQNKTSPAFSQESSTYLNLPRSFASHVDDVRKSLEAMENIPLTRQSQSFSTKKGKMKRSTSEQSLHLLHWDQDSSLAANFDRYQPREDIDDLISVYSKAQITQSQFDLLNFGQDSIF